MDTFLYLFSDHIWLPLLEFFIAAVFIWAILCDVRARVRAGSSNYAKCSVKRGEKSWARLLSFWALNIILIEIIISSDLIASHRVIVGLLNVGVLVYLNLISGYFKNKIIEWSTKLQNIED